jgi:hypothetical protein
MWLTARRTPVSLGTKIAAAALCGCATLALAVPAGAAAPPSAAALDAGIAQAISADVAASVVLPSGSYSGDVLWVFGDTTKVNGVSTTGAFGYPHDAFAVQSPNTTTWTVLPGHYGTSYGGGPWQQVPNWSDGTFFWAGGVVVDGSTVYVLGNRISQSGSSITVGDPYAAEFSLATLAYQGIVQLPGPAGEEWSGSARASLGWWVAGTRPVSCTGATDCKVGDMAWIPFGNVGTASKWQLHDGVFPATLNAGTTIAVDNTGSGWVAYTKLGDEYGTNSIGRLSATAPAGSWSLTGSYPAPSVLQANELTYDAQVHPEQPAGTGQVLVSVAENDSGAYDPQFTYLPLTG